MTESAATSTLSEQNAKLLRPSSHGLAHLADTIRNCQDALSGYLGDDSTLATSSRFGRMSKQSAASAVCACFTAAVKAFSKPFKVPGAPIGPVWPLKTVREAEGRLCKELEVLMASPLMSDTESLLTSTPNRVSCMRVCICMTLHTVSGKTIGADSEPFRWFPSLSSQPTQGDRFRVERLSDLHVSFSSMRRQDRWPRLVTVPLGARPKRHLDNAPSRPSFSHPPPLKPHPDLLLMLTRRRPWRMTQRPVLLTSLVAFSFLSPNQE